MKQHVVVVIALALSGTILAGYLISCGGGGGGGGGGGTAPAYPSSYTNAKIIFVTSTIDTGEIKGWMNGWCSNKSTVLEAADCICQEHAVRWGNLSGTYKAWLSDSTTSAASRLSHSNQNHVNRRGDLIAANWTALTNGTLQSNDVMNYDESGASASTQFHLVWTGTDAFGNVHNPLQNCNNWTSGTVSYGGVTGSATAISPNSNGLWTDWGTRYCDDWNRLYCVEQ